VVIEVEIVCVDCGVVGFEVGVGTDVDVDSVVGGGQLSSKQKISTTSEYPLELYPPPKKFVC
jgi:hypothetical protein